MKKTWTDPELCCLEISATAGESFTAKYLSSTLLGGAYVDILPQGSGVISS